MSVVFKALNEMLSNAGVPIELVDGFIESISVLVPWKALLNDSCEIEIHGLQLTFAGRQKPDGNPILCFIFLTRLGYE